MRLSINVTLLRMLPAGQRFVFICQCGIEGFVLNLSHVQPDVYEWIDTTNTTLKRLGWTNSQIKNRPAKVW